MLVFGFHLALLAARTWPELGFAGPVRAAADAYVSRVLLLTSGAYFLVGANLYLLGRDGWTLPGAAGLAASLAAGAIGLWVAAEHSAAVTIHARSPATPVLIWLAFVAGLWLSLVHHRRGGGGSLRARNLARTAGLATYPLYLFHNIAGAFVLGLLLAAGIGAYTALAVAIFLGLAVSVGFALWVEPMLRRGSRAPPRIHRDPPDLPDKALEPNMTVNMPIREALDLQRAAGASIVPVILCGGSGSRLWPVSRATFAKQHVPILGGASPFQRTLARLDAPALRRAHRDRRRRLALPRRRRGGGLGADVEIALEPQGRDTLAAVTLAACLAARRDPSADRARDALGPDRPDVAAFTPASASRAPRRRRPHRRPRASRRPGRRPASATSPAARRSAPAPAPSSASSRNPTPPAPPT